MNQPRWRGLKYGMAGMVVLVLAVAIGSAQRGPKVYLMYDMEGVTGAVEQGDYDTTSPDYGKVQQSLTEDVNAAVRGLLKAGAREVVITDCHASGNTTGPDYLIDQLPKGARFDIRDAPYDPYVEGIDKSYDALVMIGMHVRGGATNGFTPHTYFGMVRWNVNGLEMSETSEVALSAARFGIPLILVTGDNYHKAEVAEFSKAEYVIVKNAVSARNAEARPRDQVSAEIEAAAERGLKNRKEIGSYKLPAKFISQFKFPIADYTAMASNYPGAQIVDNKTLGLTTSTYLDALIAYRSISNFMRYTTSYTLIQQIRKLPGGPEMVRQAQGMLPPRNYEPTSKELEVDNKLSKWGYQ